MRKESLEFLKKLLDTPSPSGFEQEIQKVCRKYIEPFAEEIYKDVHGNQYHVLNKQAKVRIMLAGHVDEIGLMVNTIDDKGFIGFVPIGGVDGAVLGGQRVVVHGAKGPVPGVIGRKAIHLTPEKERNQPLEMHQMWVDIGASNKKDAETVVAIADPITIDVGYRQLRNDMVVARALDDRIGAFVCLEALRLLAGREMSVAVYCVTTVQEEIGLRGAITSSYGCNPQAGIAVDVAWATDHPRGEGERYGQTAIGKGPIISRGPNINPVLHKGLVTAAHKHRLPIQHYAMPRATGTDANAMQLSRGGVATALVGIPNRYMHTPVELVSLKDVVHASKLIAEWISGLKEDVSFIP
ncbi:MAG: M42 family metallopeptidase [Candidatus Hydrogenedentes bacterium]|nr:M42 family metallopeptidase [Candidatus Hydrogenedentota bacterium]MBI3119527.1 M42 family metallopeptidase [Candidatus Hydrogenedentota bacterium]